METRVSIVSPPVTPFRSVYLSSLYLFSSSSTAIRFGWNTTILTSLRRVPDRRGPFPLYVEVLGAPYGSRRNGDFFSHLVFLLPGNPSSPHFFISLRSLLLHPKTFWFLLVFGLLCGERGSCRRSLSYDDVTVFSLENLFLRIGDGDCQSSLFICFRRVAIFFDNHLLLCFTLSSVKSTIFTWRFFVGTVSSLDSCYDVEFNL